MTMHVDEGLRLLGRYSRWQLVKYTLCILGYGLPFGSAMMVIVFIADVPGHTCRVPPDTAMNDSIPVVYDNGRWRWSQCSQYVNKSQSNVTQTCQHGYQYDLNSGYESTIVTDFDLVCDRGGLGELAMSLNFAGQIIGSLFFNYLADRYGRRPVYIVTQWINVVIGFVKAFSPNFAFFAAFNFFNGIILQGIYGCGTVLCLELFPTEQRTFAGICIEFFWVVGFTIVTPLAYLIRNWRHLQMAVSLPLLFTVSYYWYLPESIPWLVANGKTKSADEIMQKAAKFNRIKIPAKIFYTSEESEFEQKQPLTHKSQIQTQGTEITPDKYRSILQICTSVPLRKYTFILGYLWFANCLIYYGVALTVTSLAGDRYLNAFIMSILELPAYLLSWLMMAKVGRLVSLCSWHMVCGVTLLLTMLQTNECCKDSLPLAITLNAVGRFSISLTFSVMVMLTPELYPTNYRNKGFGVGQSIARGAALLAPMTRIMERWKAWVPRVLFGVISLIASLLVILLPETRWRPLPETVQDIKEWQNQPKFYKPSDEKMDYTKDTEKE